MSNYQYNKEYRQKRKDFLIEKLGGECNQCGSIEELEFDHIDPSTKYTNDFRISRLLRNGRISEILKEVEKCQLLCRSCHHYKTHGVPLGSHGISKYNREGCRCNICCDAKRKTMKRSQYNKYRLSYF